MGANGGHDGVGAAAAELAWGLAGVLAVDCVDGVTWWR